MSPSFEELNSRVDYANTVGLHEILDSPDSEMLVLIKADLNFETMVTKYMKCFLPPSKSMTSQR